MFGINIHTKHDPLSAAFWLAVAQQVATAVILTLIASAFIKKPRASVPDLEAASRMVIQPNMPRQVGYGRFWVSPKIIDASNPAGQFAKFGKVDGHGGNFRGYSLLLAVCDHPVKVERFKVDGGDFMSKNELRRLNIGGAVLCSTSDEGPDRVTSVPGGPVIVVDKTVRQEANKRMNDSMRSSVIPCMQILPKLNGFFEYRQDGTVYRNYHDFSLWNRSSSAVLPNLVSRGFVDSHLYPGYEYWSLVPQTPNVYGGTRIQFQYNNWGQGVDPTQHCYGTATMYVSLPIGFRKDESPVWPTPPQIRMLCVRDDIRELRLWDPTAPGNPDIDSSWKGTNPALCICDYLLRYTRFQYPVCGYDRVDFASIARAARICHENGYEANGVFTQANSPFEVLQQLALAMNGGHFSVEGGIISIHAGERGHPVYGYDKDEIRRDSVTWSSVPRESRRGLVDVAYMDLESGTRQNVASENPDAKDALQISQTQFLFINNPRQAAKVAFILNSRAWDSEILEFELEPGVPIAPVNSIITVDLEQYIGVTGTFRVMNTQEDTESGVVTMQVQSERPDMYTADPDILLSQGNYLPPHEVGDALETHGIIMGLNADGSYQYLYWDADTFIQTNPKALANDMTNAS